VSWRPAALNLSFLTLIGWALFLGVLTGRVELILVAVPLAVALVLGRRTGAAPVLDVTHEVSTERLSEGERVTVTVTLQAATSPALVEVLVPPPPRAIVDGGNTHAFLRVRAGEPATCTFTLRCAGRQRLRLVGPFVRVWGPLGLASHEARYRAPRTVAVYPMLGPLRLLPAPRRTQASVGNYVSPAQGEGIEPGEIRPFAPGDHVRHVNWRATLRLGELHVTQHHRERNADVVLLLDTLSEVGPPGATVVDAAVRAAADLAAAYLARKDRVGLIEYGGQLRWLRPGSGRAQLQRLLDTLVDASVVFTYVTRDVDLIPSRILPPQALVLALSPLLDARFVRAAADLVARGFDLVVVAVSPVAAARATLPRGRVADLAARLWSMERRRDLDALRRRGLTIVEWDGITSLDVALAGLRRGPRRRVLA
jgi:uncharacterized protein (DUF58 family)